MTNLLRDTSFSMGGSTIKVRFRCEAIVGSYAIENHIKKNFSWQKKLAGSSSANNTYSMVVIPRNNSKGEDEKMNLYRVYTIRMCEYLTMRGFHYVSIVQDVKNPKYKNWLFEDTADLREAINQFLSTK